MRYALNMKGFNFSLTVLLLMLASSAQGEMYKHKDAEGVTIYSDIPVEGSTPIVTPEGNTIKLPKYVAKKKPAKESPDSDYSAFIIVSPENDSTVRDNSGNATITLSLTPELKIDSGHSISAFVNGIKNVSNSTSLAITINNINRGSHSVHAVVTDAEGNSLIQSNSINIHLKQFSKLH